jgi:predicted DNA-binding protein
MDSNYKTVSVRLNIELYEAFQKLAENDYRTCASVLRLLVRAYVKQAFPDGFFYSSCNPLFNHNNGEAKS